MDSLSLIVEAYEQYYERTPTATLLSRATSDEAASKRELVVGGQTVRLDDSYLALSRRVDGLAADGAQIYPLSSRASATKRGVAIDLLGVADANRHWREVYGEASELARWLIYGLDDTAFFIRNLDNGRFQHRSRRGLVRVIFECGTFEECIWEAFKYPLELGDFPEAG